MSAAEEQARAAAPATQEASETDYDRMVRTFCDEANVTEEREVNQVRSYFDEFLRQAVRMGPVVANNVDRTVKYWIGEIDKKLSAQLDEVLHHADFQKLEGTWRGLKYLVHNSETGDNLHIRVFNATKRELFKDLERAVEFDQSGLFKKIYEEEYGILGGHPYGMLVGDYDFSYKAEDVLMLQKISGIAASAHAPFVAAVSPEMFRMKSFTELGDVRDLAGIFRGVEHTSWRSFRESPDSRYLALTMPRVLGRLPYGKNFTQVDEFNYEENVDGKEHSRYLWMNSAWAYAVRVTHAFSIDGWFGRTRGVEGGGLVEGLPVHTFKTDDGSVAMKCPTEIGITDRREYELSSLGFLPLIHYKHRDCAAFIGSQTCNKPQDYFDPRDKANAELSSKLNLIMSVSRFAHYLKAMTRDRIGAIMEVADCRAWLNDWINNYVCDPATAGEEMRAQRPLAQASIEVTEIPGRPGWFTAKAFLRPHFQFEGMDAAFSLVAEVPNKGGG